ncbi:hypothetical protein DFH11DRAFT_1513995 [Phellopilus nigrolimitatus]|nr:hypothetical protein DFH11DRAFT_1513995 [Phellopilus nigrolimitatus]
MPAPNQQATTFQVASVVSFYMTAALVMVFVNKAVLNSSPDLPLLFLFIQLVIAVALLHLSAAVSSKIDIPRLELATAKKLTPVVLVNIIGLVFNTLCLRDVEASFFQIARGMVIPLTILVSSVSTRTAPAGRVVTAAGIVTLGFLLGVSPPSLSALSFSLAPAAPGVSGARDPHAAPGLLSLVYGLLSALFIAFHSVLIKSSLPHCGGSTIQLAYWTNLGSAAFLAPFVVLTGEPFKVLALLGDSLQGWNFSVFVWGSLVTGVFGFLLCIAGLLSIKVTSPVTHMFSSAARSVIQTLLGVWLFGDLLTINRATSIMVILLGTMFYTWAKHVEGQQRAAPASRFASALLGARSSSSSFSGAEEEEGMGLEDVKPKARDLEWGRLASVREDDAEVLFDAEKARA